MKKEERKEKQREIINLFRQSDQAVKRCIDRKVKDTGVYRSQHRILMMLGAHPDFTQTMLAEKLEVSPAAVAVSLKKLEKSGHISRACDELDNRMNRVVITEKGKKAIEISHRYFGEIEDFLLQDFSCEELEALSDYLKRIMKNGENYYDSLLK